MTLPCLVKMQSYTVDAAQSIQTILFKTLLSPICQQTFPKLEHTADQLQNNPLASVSEGPIKIVMLTISRNTDLTLEHYNKLASYYSNSPCRGPYV